MNREVHVRFWESPEVKVLRATRPPFGVGQQPDSSPLARASWIGGQGTSPKEQNTQQSPGFGFIRAPHIRQS